MGKKISISDVTRNPITSFWIKRIMVKNEVIKCFSSFDKLVHDPICHCALLSFYRPITILFLSLSLLASQSFLSFACSLRRKPTKAVLLHVQLFIVSHFRHNILKTWTSPLSSPRPVFSPFWNSASTTEKNYIVKSQPWKWNLFHQMLQVYVLYVKF